MWNGNGQGGDDVYGRLNNTKDVGGARYPFIEDGTHKLALAVLEEFQHSTDGPCARAILKVVESKKHPVASFVVKIWQLVKPAKFPNQPTDADMFADFCRKLKNAPIGYPIGNDIRVLMKERPADQLARGTVIDANGVANKKGNYVNVYWNSVLQTPQDVVAMRQRIEAEGVPSASGPSAPQTPQNTPPEGAYGRPAQTYTQAPGYVPAAPQPQGGYTGRLEQPAASPPPGGFLANVPTNNGNGGNQGGSW